MFEEKAKKEKRILSRERERERERKGNIMIRMKDYEVKKGGSQERNETVKGRESCKKE